MRLLRVKSGKLRVKSQKSKAEGPKSRALFTFNLSLFTVCLFLFTFHFSLFTVVSAEEIRSRAAIVMEESTGRILYGKNPSLKLLPASTTKLMTAMIALDRMSPSDAVLISEKAANTSPVKAHFKVGEKVTIETLLNAALIKSANDAAFALAEAVAGSEEKFVEIMNEKVIALGMSDTRFVNSTGLPGEGQYITAYDLARMLRQALKYPLIREIISTKASRISTEEGREMFIKNSNRLLWANESILGGKTGYTRAAKHCLVCASEHGSETIITALLGAPSRQRLWMETEKLIDKGYAVIKGSEEPILYFTKSDYKTSLKPAAYRVRTAESLDGSQEKAVKKHVKKAKRAGSKRMAKRCKPKHALNVEARG